MGKRKVRINLPALWENRLAEADQRRFIIDEPGDPRIKLAATGSKIGKTLGCSIWGTDKALNIPRSRGWWVGPYRKTAKLGFDRCVSLIPPGFADVNLSDLRIDYPNGSSIEFRSAENPDALYGDAVDFLIGDEVPRWREAAWTAVNTTMLQTLGPMRLCGNTDKGRRNFFYKLFTEGKREGSGVRSYHIRTLDAPHFMPGGSPGPQAIEEARRNLSPIAFAALILAEFPEDAATVFPGLARILVDDWEGWEFLPGPVYVPPEPDGIYVAGLDLANRRDFTVVVVIDVRTGLVVYFDRFQHMTWSDQIERIFEPFRLYQCPFLMDSTPGSVGDPLLEQLQNSGLPVEGYEFTNTTKQMLVDRAAIDVQNREVFIPRICSILTNELEELEREVTESGRIKYHAPDSDTAHDDAAISFCLANWARGDYYGIENRTGGLRNPDRGGLGRSGFI